MTEVTYKGHAKINLHLDVTGIMENGFHSVVTVMQSIGLCDIVTLSETAESGIALTCDREGVPTDRKNLAVRAVEIYCESVGVTPSYRIDIKKRIPMAAGMAGGSADAAAAFLCVNELNRNRLTAEELCRLAGQLGSDIPFCIVGGAAIASGKGDILDAFPGLPSGTVIVAACGGEGVSTPWGYRLLDTVYNEFSAYSPKDTGALRAALESGNIEKICKSMYNIFEGPILAERPVAAEIKKTLTEQGAVGAMMSGSGPSVFGIFDSISSAETAAERIRKMGHFAEVTESV